MILDLWPVSLKKRSRSAFLEKISDFGQEKDDEIPYLPNDLRKKILICWKSCSVKRSFSWLSQVMEKLVKLFYWRRVKNGPTIRKLSWVEIKSRFWLWWDSLIKGRVNSLFLLNIIWLVPSLLYIDTQSDVHGLIALHGDGPATLHGILAFRLRKQTQYKLEKTHLLDLYLKAFVRQRKSAGCGVFSKVAMLRAVFFRLNSPEINQIRATVGWTGQTEIHCWVQVQRFEKKKPCESPKK